MPSYAEIFPDLKDKPYNTFDGVHYGIPHGRGANLLMWRKDQVDPAPAHWADMFDPAGPYAGKYSVYDAAIYIADAAVVLMATQPDLGITNPYALDETQFAAAVDLLTKQKPAVGEYWSDYAKQIDSFTNGNTTLGTSWQIIVGTLQADRCRCRRHQARRGRDRLVGHLDDQLEDEEPQLRLSLPEPHHLRPGQCPDRQLLRRGAGQFEVMRDPTGGIRPRIPGFATMAELCTYFHAGDAPYWENIYYWTTPTVECLDGRTDVECKGFDDWIAAWTTIRSGN